MQAFFFVCLCISLSLYVWVWVFLHLKKKFYAIHYHIKTIKRRHFSWILLLHKCNQKEKSKHINFLFQMYAQCLKQRYTCLHKCTRKKTSLLYLFNGKFFSTFVNFFDNNNNNNNFFLLYINLCLNLFSPFPPEFCFSRAEHNMHKTYDHWLFCCKKLTFE